MVLDTLTLPQPCSTPVADNPSPSTAARLPSAINTSAPSAASTLLPFSNTTRLPSGVRSMRFKVVPVWTVMRLEKLCRTTSATSGSMPRSNCALR